MKYKAGNAYVSSLEKNGIVNIPDGAICINMVRTELGYIIYWLESCECEKD